MKMLNLSECISILQIAHWHCCFTSCPRWNNTINTWFG